MAQTYEIQVEPGRVTGTQTDPRSRETVTSEWTVPIMTLPEQDRLVKELASDPLLSGRWMSGRPTEEDRRRLGADERSWRPSCECGMRQPCRHSQSMLFQLRTEAKSNPWLWLEAAGLERTSVAREVREARAALALAASHRGASDATEQLHSRAKRAAAAQASGAPVEPPALRLPTEPAFWNRDLSFADWLRPLMTHVREKEGANEHDLDISPESDVTLDPHVHQRS